MDVNESKPIKETRGKMMQRHKRELRELKRRKGVNKKQLKALDKELRVKHAKEILEMETENQVETKDIITGLEEVKLYNTINQEDDETPKKLTRKQRRQQVRAEKDRLFDKALKEGQSLDTKRSKELEVISSKLTELGCVVKEVPSDGNCLYFAIADQLTITSSGREDTPSYLELRKITAQKIRENKEEYSPFLEDVDDFERYCDNIENTSEWGGQVEITALSHALQKPIVVHSTGADVKMGDQYDSPNLRISFHRHYLSAGNHYNSVVPSM